MGPEGWKAPGPDQRVAEVHGRHVSAAGGTPITWFPSGEEVTFASADYRILYAHHARDGSNRQLYASTSAILNAAMSADGVDWFTTSSERGYPDTLRFAMVIRRHTSAGSTVLTDRGGGVLTAPAAPIAAFIVQPDSVFLLGRGAEPSLLGVGCLRLLAFSPDQSRVLCDATSGPQSFRVFRTDGGATEALALPAAVTSPRLIRWDTTGIHVLHGYPEAYLYDHSTGSSRSLGGINLPINQKRVAWSRDGTKVAFWHDYCAQSQSGSFSFATFPPGPEYRCLISQGFLYLLDVATATTTRVAVHTSSVAYGGVSLSPK